MMTPALKFQGSARPALSNSMVGAGDDHHDDYEDGGVNGDLEHEEEDRPAHNEDDDEDEGEDEDDEGGCEVNLSVGTCVRSLCVFIVLLSLC
jgi:hypothetical protein